jgi:hypothetical protein
MRLNPYRRVIALDDALLGPRSPAFVVRRARIIPEFPEIGRHGGLTVGGSHRIVNCVTEACE